MTPDQQDLARRLVEADWWEWKPGMRWISYWDDAKCHVSDVVWRIDSDGCPRSFVGVEDGKALHANLPDGAVPDLSDPATVGVLLGMLMDACGPDVGATLERCRDRANGSRCFNFHASGGIDIYGPDLCTAVSKALLAVKGGGR